MGKTKKVIARPCNGTTKAGAPCKNAARTGESYCQQHRHLEDLQYGYEFADDRSKRVKKIERDLSEALDAGDLPSRNELLRVLGGIALADPEFHEEKMTGGDGLTILVPPASRDRINAARILLPFLDEVPDDAESESGFGESMMRFQGMVDLYSDDEENADGNAAD